jgi:hypothetical protein
MGRCVAGLSLVAAAAACGVGWHDQAIGEVTAPDERTLMVGVHCNPDASVEVSETDQEVVLKLRVYDDSMGDCASFERVELESPLADRTVIDGVTGERVRVRAGG